MFATDHNMHLPQLSLVSSSGASSTGDRCLVTGLTGEVNVHVSPAQQSHSEPQMGEMILVTPWWPSKPWFPHLLRLSVDHPRFFQYRRDLLSQQGYISSGKSYHLQEWRLLCSTTKQQVFSREASKLAAAPTCRRPSTNRMYDDRWLRFTTWATERGFDPFGHTAAQIAAFLYELFDTHGVSPQPIKGYRSCLASLATRAWARSPG